MDSATRPGPLTENPDGQKVWHFCVYNGAYVFNFGVPSFARMAELADARDSKSRALKRRVGSTPTPGTSQHSYFSEEKIRETLQKASETFIFVDTELDTNPG